MAMEMSPRPAILPAAKVRRYSCHHYAKNDVSDIRREFVGTNKRINYVPPSIPQQVSPVSRVHLMKLVGRIGKRERSKGSHLTDSMFKEPHLGDEKVMTSLLLPGQKAEERNTQSSLMLKGTNSSEIGLGNHKYPYINNKSTRKGLKANKKEQEVESKLSGSTNYDVINDATTDGDVTLRDPDVDRLIARKRYIPRKRSLMHSVGSFEKSLRACSRTVTFMALLLAIVINVTGGLVNIRPSERKSTVGNSPSLPLSGPISSLRFPASVFLYILRDLATFILCINKGFCHCMITEAIGNNNKRLKRRREVLHNTRIRDEGGYGHTGYSHRPPGCHGYAMCIMQSLARIFLAGKRLSTYIFPFADFWASRMFYSNIYTVNLELDDNFKVSFDLIYLYIYNVYRSWVSCKGATYPADIFTKTYTLVYFLPKVIALVIKSHDKYQSIILIGLTYAERANSEK